MSASSVLDAMSIASICEYVSQRATKEIDSLHSIYQTVVSERDGAFNQIAELQLQLKAQTELSSKLSQVNEALSAQNKQTQNMLENVRSFLSAPAPNQSVYAYQPSALDQPVSPVSYTLPATPSFNPRIEASPSTMTMDQMQRLSSSVLSNSHRSLPTSAPHSAAAPTLPLIKPVSQINLPQTMNTPAPVRLARPVFSVGQHASSSLIAEIDQTLLASADEDPSLELSKSTIHFGSMSALKPHQTPVVSDFMATQQLVQEHVNVAADSWQEVLPISSITASALRGTPIKYSQPRSAPTPSFTTPMKQNPIPTPLSASKSGNVLSMSQLLSATPIQPSPALKTPQASSAVGAPPKDMASEAVAFFKEAREALPAESLLKLLELLRHVSTDAERVNMDGSQMNLSTRTLMQNALSILEQYPILFSKFCMLVQG